MKIGLFGGTFNPIHMGHLRAAEEAREMLQLDRVLFIPSGNPPLKKKEIAEASHRYRMTCLAAEGNPFFEVTDVEAVLPGKSYTVDTIENLKDAYPDAELFFILGIDAFLDIPNWYKPGRLVSLLDFVVLSRPGRSFTDLRSSPYVDETCGCSSSDFASLCPCPLKSGRTAVLLKVTPMDISSSDIRRRIGQGLSTKYLLPEKVEFFIISNKLYNSFVSR